MTLKKTGKLMLITTQQDEIKTECITGSTSLVDRQKLNTKIIANTDCLTTTNQSHCGITSRSDSYTLKAQENNYRTQR